MPIRVFLADDHAVVRDGLRLLLEKTGDIEVVGDAGSGRKTIRSVLRLSPDIVIMDIAMPDLNGIEAMTEILHHHPGTRMIILSMYAHTQAIRRALQAGAMGYLPKESASKEIVEAVRTVHRGSRYLSSDISNLVIEDYAKPDRAKQAQDPLGCLSARERQILDFVVEGQSSAQIAETLCLSAKSVETYRSRLMKKLGARRFLDLVKFVVRHNLITVDSAVPD